MNPSTLNAPLVAAHPPHISLRALATDPAYATPWLRYAAPLLDRLLGIHTLDQAYRKHRMQGLPPFDFIERTLGALDLTVAPAPGDWASQVPARGPLLVVCNHPYGGAEALALAQALRALRSDIKFLANSGLGVFQELRPLLIGVNPLKITQKNLGAIRQCELHLAQGGVLILFPAGRVSSRSRGGERIADATWNRLVGHLARRSEATLLPVFFHGTNSPLFQWVGSIWNPAKILLLPREFLHLRGRTLHFTVGRALPAPLWRHLSPDALTRFARAMTYLLESAPDAAADASGYTENAPLAPLSDSGLIERELAALPERQHLLDYQHFSVYFASAAQIPCLMDDIGRERERVFRMHDEGSGKARDGDAFDASYVQLFVWDHRDHALVGAYRLGRAKALRGAGATGTYLARMFDFDATFYDSAPPSLEMGRSFVVPEHQKNFYSLYLLWRGIGRYLALHPQYRRLYGTVSLSRQYAANTIALICDALIEPSTHVRPREALNVALHPEWQDYRRAQGRLDLPTLSACVRALDQQGRDIPVLLKHYLKLGARFHCVGVDANFNRTPGLLLSVDMESIPEKSLRTFLAQDAAAYLAYSDAEAEPC